MLAALAVVFKVVIPAGFMTAPAAKNGLPFALVICTGQGPLVVQPGDAIGHHDDGDPADRAAHDSPCAFAGQGVAAPPPNLVEVATVDFVAYRPAVFPSRASTAPGRGLAAPPLPARGPPSLLI
ncbi:MAG: hypothetical protein JWP92_931 [Caulobacter sp.]|nr:hypothetical protein [Caulobacter sp.]